MIKSDLNLISHLPGAEYPEAEKIVTIKINIKMLKKWNKIVTLKQKNEND